MAGHSISFRSVDLQNDDDPAQATIWFDLPVGLAEPPEIRGEDVVIPGKAGQTWMTKVDDYRLIELDGYVQGQGVGLEARQQSWRQATDALMAIMDRTAAPGTLEVSGPYLGIAPGQTFSIEATCWRIVPGIILARMTFQRWSLALKAYDVDWQAGSS